MTKQPFPLCKDEKKVLKEKFNTQFVIIWKEHYFGLDFKNRIIKEISFDEAYGCSFFDWTNSICIASDWCKEQYEEARGEDGCGILSKRYFYNRNDLLDFNKLLCKEVTPHD